MRKKRLKRISYRTNIDQEINLNHELFVRRHISIYKFFLDQTYSSFLSAVLEDLHFGWNVFIRTNKYSDNAGLRAFT